MRIPGTKIWRAFKELDHLTDSECQSLILRVYLQVSPVRMRVFVALACLCGLLGAGGVLLLGERMGYMGNDENVPALAGAALVGGVLSLGVAYLVLRDLHVYLLIRADLKRSNCRHCGQSLLGVPVRRSALHPGTPGDARVTCPECGRSWILLEIGISEQDLVPFEFRVASPQVGKSIRAQAPDAQLRGYPKA